MKHLLLFYLLSFFPLIGVTQICETPDISEEDYVGLPWYGDEFFLQNFYDSLANPQNNPALRIVNDVWLRVPIKFWVYQISAGNPGGNNFPNELSFQLMMDDLNNAFRENGIKMQFYMREVAYINDQNALTLNNLAEQIELAEIKYKDPDAINVHVVDQGTSGVYNPIYNAIFIPRRSGINVLEANTLTHEVGHYFGLLHTHFLKGIPCFQEPVTRGWKINPCAGFPFGYNKRCLFTGDLLCDTDADPQMREHGLYNQGNCT